MLHILQLAFEFKKSHMQFFSSKFHVTNSAFNVKNNESVNPSWKLYWSHYERDLSLPNGFKYQFTLHLAMSQTDKLT